VPRPFRRRAATDTSIATYVESADSVPSMSRLPTARRIGLVIGAGRALLGATVLAAPVTSVRIFGVDTGTASRVVWLTRMTAARDTVLGVGTLNAIARSTSGGPWLLAGAVSDAADAAAIGAALRANRVRGVGALGAVGVAVAAAVVGVWAAAEAVHRH
jgi:hypothetical protein